MSLCFQARTGTSDARLCFQAPRGFPVAGTVALPGIPEELARRIVRDLTFPNPAYVRALRENGPAADGLVPEIPAYKVRDGVLHVPRHYWRPEIGAHGLPRPVLLSSGDFVHVLRTAPRPAQEEVVRQLDALGHLDVGLQLPCGFGKSYLALYYAAKRPGRVLVVAPTEVKLNEWREEVCRHLGLERRQVGHVQASTRRWEDCPVVVTMLKTLATQDFPPEFELGFSTVVWDEAHLVGAPMMSRALGRVAGVQVGLSATPGRDVRRRILNLCVGDTWLQTDAARRKMTWHLLRVRVAERIHGKEWRFQKIALAKDRRYSSVAAHYARHLRDEGRRVLVLNSLVDPLVHVYDLLSAPGELPGDERAGFVVGTASLRFVADEVFARVRHQIEAQPGGSWPRQAAAYIAAVKQSSNPILATGLTKTQPGGMGMDVPDLDGGVVMFPVPERDMVVQMSGRWNRDHPTKKDPVVVVTVPDTSAGRSAAAAMAAHLRGTGAEVVEHPHPI